MAKQMFSGNARSVIRFLQGHAGDFTADDIAAGTDLTSRSVNGTVTGLAKKGFAERIEMEGYEKKIIRLTSAGMSADPDAITE